MMLHRLSRTAAIATLMIIPAVLASDPASEGSAAKVMCPVMDEPANLLISAEDDKGPVYFCCNDCVERFTANPAKYAEKVAAQRAALAKLPKIQVKCPLTGEPANPKVTAEHNGETVSFCCQRCVSKFKTNPASYEKALAGSYTYQTTCPVMGEKIDPKAFSTLPTGGTIYYCCKGCDKKLMADPSKYNANLTRQGVYVDWEKVKAGSGS